MLFVNFTWNRARSIVRDFNRPLAIIMTLSSFVKNKLKWDEPLGLTTITATVTGSFVIIAPPPSYRRFFYYLSWYQLVMFAIFMTGAALKAVTATDFFSESMEALRFLVTSVHILAKHLTMRVKEKEFLGLINQIRAAWGTYQPSNRDFLSRTLRSSNKYTVVIFTAILFTAVPNVLGAYAKNLNNPEEIQYPLQVWIPASLRSSFLAGSLFQMVPYWTPLIIYCTTVSFLNSITSHVEALGLSLARDIRRQKEWTEAGARTLYKKHREVVRIVYRVNALMASNWGFEMMCSTLQLTLVAYNALRCLKRNDVEFVNQAVLLFANFAVIYLIHGNGNRIIQMGEDLHDSLYASDWHESTVKERKNILFMMLRTTYPMEYKYKIIHFDLPGFSKAFERNDVEFLNHAVILCLNLMVIYIIFAGGNRILSVGEEIRARMCESDWFQLPIKEKKNIIFMLFRATKPVEYRYIILPLDLPGFTKMMNAVISYMELLRLLD